MILSLKHLQFGCTAVLALLLSGCASTPFVPIAIPEATMLRPKPQVDRRIKLIEFYSESPIFFDNFPENSRKELLPSAKIVPHYEYWQ